MMMIDIADIAGWDDTTCTVWYYVYDSLWGSYTQYEYRDEYRDEGDC